VSGMVTRFWVDWRKETAAALLRSERAEDLQDRTPFVGPAVLVEEAFDEGMDPKKYEFVCFMPLIELQGYCFLKLDDFFGVWEIASVLVDKLTAPPKGLGTLLIAKALMILFGKNVRYCRAAVHKDNIGSFKVLGYGMRWAKWAKGYITKERPVPPAVGSDEDYREVHLFFEKLSREVLESYAIDEDHELTQCLLSVSKEGDVRQ
jgi:hypothetical protein